MDGVDLTVSVIALLYVLYTGLTLYRELRAEKREADMYDQYDPYADVTWWDADARCWRNL